MDRNINPVKAVMSEAIDILEKSDKQIRLGLGTFEDKNGYKHGGKNEFVARIMLTTDFTEIRNEISNLNDCGCGEDEYESHLNAIHKAIIGSIGEWKYSATKKIIILTDEPPHDPDVIDPSINLTSKSITKLLKSENISLSMINVDTSTSSQVLCKIVEASGGTCYDADSVEQISTLFLNSIKESTHDPILQNWFRDVSDWWYSGLISDQQFIELSDNLLKRDIIEKDRVMELPVYVEIIKDNNPGNGIHLTLDAIEFKKPRGSYENQMVTISGFVDDYHRAESVFITVTPPNDELFEQEILANEGHFNALYPLSKESKIGDYIVSLKYKSTTDSIGFIVGNTLGGSDELIPQEIKEYAYAWSKGQILEDLFVGGLKYMIVNNMIG